MGEAFLYGNGGVSLNFKVVGGTSAPSNPTENTIWVNTSTTITSWMLSSTQPSSATGKVWIKTAESSAVAFNTLKRNGVQVYPVIAYQYNGSSWVTKDAKIYQGGAWKAWTLTIVPNSSSYPSSAWKTYSSTTDSSFQPSITVNSTSAVINCSAYKNDGANRVYIPIDVTNYTTMTIAGTCVEPNNPYGANFYVYVGMYASATSGSMDVGYSTHVTKDDSTTTIAETNYDISGLTGTYYFEVHVINYASSSDLKANPTITLTKVHFE